MLFVAFMALAIVVPLVVGAGDRAEFRAAAAEVTPSRSAFLALTDRLEQGHLPTLPELALTVDSMVEPFRRAAVRHDDFSGPHRDLLYLQQLVHGDGTPEELGQLGRSRRPSTPPAAGSTCAPATPAATYAKVRARRGCLGPVAPLSQMPLDWTAIPPHGSPLERTVAWMSYSKCVLDYVGADTRSRLPRPSTGTACQGRSGACRPQRPRGWPAGCSLRRTHRFTLLVEEPGPAGLARLRRGTLPDVVPASLVPQLRRARDLADRRYSQPLDLDTLAHVAMVSKYHFARCFAETYGETPIRYLTRRRIERAQDLLRSANLTVTEVCMLVGFSSLGSFSSRFHELVGESPTQYRDRWATLGEPRIPGCFLFMRGVDRWPGAGEQAGRSVPAG